MRQKKLKKQVWVVLAVIIVLCILAGSTLLRKKESKQDGSGSDASIIENEGNIEIIIPEDMESDGF